MLDSIITFVTEQQVLSGLGTITIVAVGTWLFRKRGETQDNTDEKIDSSSIINEKVEEQPPPNFSPVVHDEKISKLRPVDIMKAFDSATPYQKQTVGNNYIGIKIDWHHGELAGVGSDSPTKNEKVNVSIWFSRELTHPILVICNVFISDYPELKILEENASIRIRGKIKEMNRFDINIKDAELFFD